MAIFWRKTSFSYHQILPGDIGDARFTTSLYEHWYLYFTGKLSLTENYFFAPVENTLSMSDAFLFQGLIHSFFRGIGCSIIFAWLLSTIFTHALGSYSAILISKQLKLNFFPSSLFLIFWGFNSVLWVQRGHVQSLAYPLLGVPLFFIIKSYNCKKIKLKIIFASIAISSLFIVGLSAGYVFVFSILLISFLFTFYATRKLIGIKIIKIGLILQSINRSKLNLAGQMRTNSLLFLFASIFAFLPLWILFQIYYVSNSNLIERPPAETVFYSPTFSELIEVPPSNIFFGKFVEFLTKGTIPPVGERYMGFSLTFLFLCVFCTFLVKKDKKYFFNANHLVAITAMSLIAIELFILKDARGINLWYFTFSRLPFFDSIRGMSRYHQFVYMIGGLLVALILDRSNYLKKLNLNFGSRKTLSLSLLILFAFSEMSGSYGSWTAKEMHPIAISKKEMQGCRYFALFPVQKTFETRPTYALVIDAQITALNLEIPTVSGYSGGVPKNYDIDFTNSLNNQITTETYVLKNQLHNFCSLSNSDHNLRIWTVNKY